jgi:hypothetical protein
MTKPSLSVGQRVLYRPTMIVGEVQRLDMPGPFPVQVRYYERKGFALEFVAEELEPTDLPLSRWRAPLVKMIFNDGAVIAPKQWLDTFAAPTGRKAS